MKPTTSLVLAGLLVSLLALISGCASQVVVPTDAARAELRGARTVRVVHVVGEPFRVATPAAALGGIVGWALDREMGKSWAQKLGADAFPDPIIDVKERFVAALGGQAVLPTVTVVPEAVPDNGREAFQRTFRDGLTFDLETKDWSLIQPSGFSADYRLVYKARVRLVSVQDWRILWQVDCDARGPTRASYQAFGADGGRLARAEVAKAVEACSKQLIDGFSTAGMATVR